MAARHHALFILLLAPVAALAQSAAVVMMPPVQPMASGDSGISGARPSTIRVLSAADRDLYLRAYAAGASHDWAGAMALANQGKDSVARQLLQWRYALDRESGATFTEIDAVMKFAASWPLKGTLQARAEAAIQPDPSQPSAMTPEQTIAWFAAHDPNSSIGRIRYGEALVAAGQIAKGAPLIARGWVEGSFDEATEAAILQQDAAYISAANDKARLDNLVWRDETGAARRQLARVDAPTATIARARIALDGGTRAARTALKGLEGTSDPALLLDWSRALRLEKKDAEAHRRLMRAAPATLAKDHTARWWNEISVQARDLLKDGNPKAALAMVDHAMLPASDQYADQQFLGGFIALRFLKDAKAALPYFQRLTAAVSRPISKSRGEYWQARAYEALGDNAGAIAHYKLAATFPETFYGQLAQARTDAAPLLHVADTPVVAAARAEIENDRLMPQIRVLADLGQAGDLRLFAAADAEVYSSPRHIKAFMQALTEWGYLEISVRLAKNASYAGATMLDYTHPVIPLPAYKGPGTAPEPALVHGLIRQETEFDPNAISSAGAKGLMQMMPASAKKAAQQGGLPYRPNDLLTDRDYNIQLGMIEYAGHLSNWNGSLVLAASAYNAGPTNARRWIAAYGDPRTGTVDPVDWIEQIPFGETRNYVQRVLENTEVYRTRLAGKDLPLQIMGDLYAPAAPVTVVLNAPVTAAPVKAR